MTLPQLPPFLLGAAALFWGWLTGNLLVGAALALALESPRVIKVRLALDEADYRRIADFCAVLLAGVAVLLLVNRGAARGVLSTLQWLPLLLAPLYLAQRYGGGLRASALFLYVRRRLRRDPGFPNPLLDLGGPYLALLLISAGAGSLSSAVYYAGVALVAAWALFAIRPRSSHAAAFALMLAIAAGAGHFTHTGLHSLQAILEAWVDDWLVMLPNDAERTRTAMGSIGRIKEHDTIALRLYAPDAARPQLLHQASFNVYRGTNWLAREQPVPTSAPAATPPAPHSAAIVLRTQGGRALLPLPAGTSEVLGVPEGVRRTRLGATLADAKRGWLRYEAAYGGTDAGYAAPASLDLHLPEAERAALGRVAAAVGLEEGMPGDAAVASLARHFGGFAYSLWRDRGPEGTALGDFLERTRSGHCEYFATATTLLLRAAGIPARYVTGYAVIEHSDLEGAWVVRARHAHAWSRAFIGGRWVDVDLTPATWARDEAVLAPAWERLADFARWLAFRWSTRGEQDAEWPWWVAGGVVTLLLGWWLSRRRRVGQAPAARAALERAWPGRDSEFYALERSLSARFRPRAEHEPLGAWFRALEKHLDASERERLGALLELHQRYRFDPPGLSPAERRRLRAG